MNKLKRLITLFRLNRLTRMSTLELYEHKLKLEDKLMEIQVIVQGRTSHYDAPITVKEHALWRETANHDLPTALGEVDKI